ncbi:MAG: hypothetical protein Ta2G_03460 [Termitinemataceae bacterium]|nr:MAG: hypothetical protein Ta2G_03460 [Termitinemataceae bacterium]
MFSKLINCFEQNAFAMGLVFLLWIIIYDEKAIERLRKPMIKKIFYVTIILFYISIILPVILPFIS